jgi:hypothetical protein
MVFISLSIFFLLFPSSLLLGDLPVLELFLNGFVPSSDVFSLAAFFHCYFHSLVTFYVSNPCTVTIVVFVPKHGLLNTKFLWEEETRVFPFF